EELSKLPPIGRPFSDAFTLEAAKPQQEDLLPRSVAAEAFDTLLATRAFHGIEVRLSGNEAAGRTFLLSAGPLLDDNKRPVGSIVTLTDITARKHAEEQQAVMMAELNHRVKNIL